MPIRYTTYKTTNKWKTAADVISEDDVRRIMADVAHSFERRMHETMFHGEKPDVQLIFPRQTEAQKEAAWAWKLYVERMPFSPYRMVQR